MTPWNLCHRLWHKLIIPSNVNPDIPSYIIYPTNFRENLCVIYEQQAFALPSGGVTESGPVTSGEIPLTFVKIFV
jgi:hypothetical protein